MTNQHYCIYQITPELQEHKDTKWKCEDCRVRNDIQLCKYYYEVSSERLKFMFSESYLEKRLIQVN